MVLAAINIFDPIFIGDFWGFVLALPIALLLSFWIGSDSVRHPGRGALGAFVGALLGFFIILGWAGTLFFSTPMPGANGASAFFSSVLLCSVLGIVGGILTDRVILGRSSRNSA